jgi:hypothetical protein
LRSELGSGTNVTAAGPSTLSATSGASGFPQINGGGSAEGSRGGSGSGDSGSSGNGFSQGGGTSQASTFRGISQIVAIWSAIVGLVVGGMFTLL